LASSARITGPRIHDARIAALCRQHQVRELWSADRDFGRFAELKVSNSLTRA
jgi:predicted nucleic acid-binding protein